MVDEAYYYQLTRQQYTAVELNAALARDIFKQPVFSASGGSWRWRSYHHIATGTDIKVDTLKGTVHFFLYGYVTEGGQRAVTIPLDVFSDETVVLTKWKPRPEGTEPPQDCEQLQFSL